MALDVSGLIIKPSEFEGLTQAGQTLERRKLKEEDQKQKKEAGKRATANFLTNYLDPKDYLTGTAYDPTLIKGFNDLMQQGASLAAQGADPTQLIMALGPGVSRLSNYSSKAKGINQKIDEQIKGLKDSGVTGVDYSKLREVALGTAFQTKDGVLDIESADPSVNYIGKALQDRPEDFTTSEGLDEYARKSPMTKRLSDVSRYSKTGGLTREKAHVIGQNWLTEDMDDEGNTVLVPKYEYATDNGKPIVETIKDKSGQSHLRQIRLLDEGEFDRMMEGDIGSNLYMRGQINQALKDHEKETGEKVNRDSPQAKRIARAVAYQELDKRKTSTIENVDVMGKPSPQEVTLKVGSSPEYKQMLEEQAAARKEGRLSVLSPTEQEKLNEVNVGQAIGNIFKGKEDFTSGERQVRKGRNVVEVTSSIPGGGFKKNRGSDIAFKKVFYDPVKRELIVETEKKETSSGKITPKDRVIPEAEVGQFISEIAEANGLKVNQVRGVLDKMGYKNGKFTGVDDSRLVEEMSKPVPDTKADKSLEKFEKDASTGALTNGYKGKFVGDMEILEFDTKWFSGNKFQVKLKSPDGKTEWKPLKDKQAVTDFVKQVGKPAEPKIPTEYKGDKIKNKSGKVLIWDNASKKYKPA